MEECHIAVANESKDVSVCDNIEIREFNSMQYSNLRGNYTEKQIHGRQNKALCKAMAKDDVTECKALEAYSARDAVSCVSKFALMKNDQQLCSKILDDFSRDDCYEKIIYATHDDSLCSKIVDAKTKKSIFLCMTEDEKEARLATLCR